MSSSSWSVEICTLRGCSLSLTVFVFIRLGIPFDDPVNWRLQIAESAQEILGDNLLGLQAGNEPDFYQLYVHALSCSFSKVSLFSIFFCQSGSSAVRCTPRSSTPKSSMILLRRSMRTHVSRINICYLALVWQQYS